jgi:pimeloyl-ACP methyl ester carboxylesterase
MAVTAIDQIAPVDERFAPVGRGIELAYEEIGDPGGVPLLLIMGLATQMIHWDRRFCEQLAERGFRVIRFDNRDIGHSTKLTSAPVPGTAPMLLGLGDPAYLLSDMATDVAGLLDHLEIGETHVMGASMGGMIAQTLAIEHPRRVSSMVSIMAGAGRRLTGVPRFRAFGALLARPGRTRDEVIETAVKTFGVIGSPAFPSDEERFRRAVGVSYDRGHYPPGVARQLHAINSSGSRRRALRGLRMPVAVVHGADDPLVRPIAGRDVARAIPGARLRMIEGMGHDLPPQVWPALIEDLERNVEPSGRSRPSQVGAAATQD